MGARAYTGRARAYMPLDPTGRGAVGIGGGWKAEEMEARGTDFKQRWGVLRERVLAMKRIGTEDEGSFEGAFVRFPPLWSWPKPVQKPHPPILLGGHGPRALARVVDYCDGWLPISVRAGDLEAGMAELRRLASEKGRDPRSISVSVYGAPMDVAGRGRLPPPRGGPPPLPPPPPAGAPPPPPLPRPRRR